MKKKTIFAIALIAFMCMFGSEYVEAATGLSEAEKSIVNTLKAGIEVKGKMEFIPISYINQVENEFIKNDKDVTPEQAAVINRKIYEAIDIVKTSGLKDAADIKNSISALKIIKLADEAADMLNYTVSINISDMSINVRDPEGNSILVSKSIINQTGFDLSSALIVGGAFILLFLACCIITVRLKFFLTSDYADRLFDNMKEDKGVRNKHEE